MNEKLLIDKNIILTGTSRGIGKTTLKLCAQNGANIFAHARRESEEHRTFCEELEMKYSVKVIPLYFDLTDINAIKEAIKKIRSYKIPIDGLVNNAGITYNALFQMTDISELKNQFEVNFFGPFLLTQYVSKLMVRFKKGSIVNISSTAALDGNSGKAAYGASKAALICTTKTIAEELGHLGIRANVVCPGATNTDMLGTMPDYILDIQKDAACLKKLAEPTDIARTVIFLLSDLSNYITGQVIRVDGGVTNYRKHN